jgi:hypothetical protein
VHVDVALPSDDQSRRYLTAEAIAAYSRWCSEHAFVNA